MGVQAVRTALLSALAGAGGLWAGVCARPLPPHSVAQSGLPVTALSPLPTPVHQPSTTWWHSRHHGPRQVCVHGWWEQTCLGTHSSGQAP